MKLWCQQSAKAITQEGHISDPDRPEVGAPMPLSVVSVPPSNT